MKLQSKTNTVSVPAIYSFYFLTFEPVAALGGVFLCFFQPEAFAVRTNPHTHPPPLPLTKHGEQLLVAVGSLYIFFAITEILVLRATRELAVWKAVCLGILFSDMGHLYMLTMLGAGTGALYEVWAFNSDDCINVGTLWLGGLLRLFFILGVGFKTVSAVKSGGEQVSGSGLGDGLLW